MSFAGRWIAVVLALPWPLVAWAQHEPLPSPASPGPAVSPWLADSLRWVGIAMPPALGDCPSEPHGPHRLPPRPEGNWLGVMFADGRQSCWDSLSAISGTLYWPLERACHTLGCPLTWDPVLLRGELLVADTARCGFIVGGEVLQCGGLALQMEAPVLYLGDRVLLPLDCLSLITREIYKDRFTYDVGSRLLVQRPAPGPLAEMTSEQVGNRSYFAWKIPAGTAASFSTDGIATITVHVPGARLDPRNPPRPAACEGGCLWALRPVPDGLDYVLRVDPRVRAWRVQLREKAGEVRLSLSTYAFDRGRDGYSGWAPPEAIAGGERQGPVLLVLPDTGGGSFARAPAAVGEFLREVVDQVRARLENGGIEVMVIETTGRSDWLRSAGAHPPSACVCLLPNLGGYDLLPANRLVTAVPLPGERPQAALEDLRAPRVEPEGPRGGRFSPPVLRRWEAVAPAHASGTHRLTWLMGLYLETEFPRATFDQEHWPAVFFDGLDAPAMAIYLGDASRFGEDEPPPAGTDTLWAPSPLPDRLAASIAGAIFMFTMGAGGE